MSMPSPKHTCHRPGCDVSVPPKMLACRNDWYLLPKNIRDGVLAAYRPGQEKTKTPSREYLAAAQKAINYWQSL